MASETGEMIEIDEITRRMAKKVLTHPNLIPNLIDEAFDIVRAPDFGGYGADFSHDEEPWLDQTRIQRISTPEIDQCRDTLIRGEAHHQISAVFVQLMLEAEIPMIGALPARIGDRPEHRAAAAFTPLMSNHELDLFELLQNREGAQTFNRGIPMGQRYYLATNNAVAFIGYEAKVMAGLALWSVDKEVQGTRISYYIRPGPCLAKFMGTYFKLVEWAHGVLKRAAQPHPLKS